MCFNNIEKYDGYADPYGYDSKIHRRRSIRLKKYDYSQCGAYFITICAQNREHLFGKIINNEMQLNVAGKIIQKWWLELSNKFSHIELNEYIVMPNHFHGIVQIVETEGRSRRTAPTIPHIIQWFKTMSTNEYIRGVKIGKFLPFNKSIWQRNYWEHIIRSEGYLIKFREYMANNPCNWKNDKLHSI